MMQSKPRGSTAQTTRKEATPVAKALKKKETFTFKDSGAANVALVGDFTDWERHPIALKRERDGMWSTTVALEPGPHEYRFLVDGQWRDDAQCAVRRANPFGAENCVRDVAP
jgi:1,4-alpha-glucan branching enzyme